MRFILAAMALATAAIPAQASWYQASSAHFLIYSEQKPEILRGFAVKLEKFDKAVRVVRNMEDLPLSYGNRVTIFVVENEKEVQRLANDKTGFIAGFYRGSAAGSVAFVPRGGPKLGQSEAYTGSRIGSSSPDGSMGPGIVLLHEYSHHLMMQDLASPYPEWLVEGFAEVMSTAQFEKNGSVGLGLPAMHRAYGLLEGRSLPLETLLSGHYDKITVEERESIYGRGWLMTHYLTFEPSRKGQLSAYVAALAKGADPVETARQVFGDLKQFGRDLDKYLNRSTLQYLKVSGQALAPGPIEVTQLNPAGSAVLPVVIELKNGVPEKAAEALGQKARAIEASYPGDVLVETTLAEAELNAGHADAADAAADRALKTNPRSTDAMILKGRALTAQARKAAEPSQTAFIAARKWFSYANKIDPEDPEPLMEFYMSFAYAGVRPTANAIAALHYASDLAPQDGGLRINSAMQYLRDGKLKEARAALIPIAYDPHGRQNAAAARSMIVLIDAGDAKGAEHAAETGFESR
ncbi:hypothetical protein [Sphingomonas sp.]|uniref:tetratricopeptide repeat protein n=1 Tax=Sphingomonas sp. TaxID=28214 RepID=UPI00286D21C2|nr:hypothetical protein [Sphingomonas sp.]